MFEMENTLSIRFLGSLDIQVGSQPVTGFISGKAKALFIYLAVTARPWNRSTLATLFWGDIGETAARRNLSKCLSNLRRLVGDYLHIERHRVAFQTERSYWLDVVIFEQALADALAFPQPSNPPTPVQDAVALYRGDFLEGFLVRNAPDFEAWMRAERERLRSLQREALVHLSSHADDLNDLGQAIRWIQQLLHLEPTDEQAHRQLMAFLARNGQRTLALAQYTTCCQILAQELDVEPAAETIELYAQIRDGGELRHDDKYLAHHASDPTNLRRTQPEPEPRASRSVQDEQLFSLTGRDEEWQRLRTAWQQALVNDTHFCLIHGEAGVGKTRLAEELLNWAQEQDIAIARTRAYAAAGELAYTPIIDWLRSPPLQQALRTLDEVWLMEIARILPELATDSHRAASQQPSFESVGESQWQRQRLFDALARAFHAGTHPKVLLMDDVQWCDGESLAWLHYFLQGSRQVSTTIAPTLIVGTARPEIWHKAHALAPMLTHLRSAERMTEIALGPLDASATAALASQATQTELTSAQTADLYRYTEGNPLFVIESVRARAWQTKSNKVVEDEQKAAWPSLPTALNEQPTPPQSALPPKIQAVIQERLAQLSPTARALAGLAAVIGRSFDLALLRRASTEEEADVVAGLDELWQQGIVRAQGNQHFDFSHDRIREVAYLTVGPVQRPVWHRQVADALEELHAADVAPVSAQLAFHFEEAGDIERAIHYYQQAAKLAHGIFADKKAVALLQKALGMTAKLPSTRQHKETELSLLLAMILPLNNTEGYRSAMQEVCTRAKVLSEELGALRDQFSALQGLRTFYQQRAEYVMAHRIAKEMVNLAQHMDQITDKDDEENAIRNQMVYHSLGNILFFQGKLTASQSSRRRAVTYGKPSVGIFMFSAITLWLLGYPDQARESTIKGWIMARSQGNLSDLGLAMTCTARFNYLIGSIPQMQLWAKKILELYSEAHDLPRWGQVAQLLLAYTQTVQGDVEEGLPMLQAMIQKMDADQHFVNRSHSLVLLAESYAYAKQQNNALKTVNEAIDFCESTGERYLHAELLRLRGDYRLALGASPVEVESAYQEAISVAQEQQARSFELRATMSLARLWQQEGKQEAAHTRLAAIYNWFTEGFNTVDLRAARAMLAELANPRIDAPGTGRR